MPQKGQVLSEESKEKMRQSKQLRMLSKFNWILIEPYLDVKIENGSTGRQKEHISFRQFKEMLESGKSLKDIIRLGVSKHLVYFMGNFAQSKIRLTKEEFEKDYLSGLSLKEIAKKHEINYEDITFLRQLYDINRKGAKFIHRKKTEVPLTQRQLDILYGSMLGDAKKVSLSAAGFGHSGKQKDYLFWKFNEFESVASKKSLKFGQYYDNRFKKQYVFWRFYTHANTDIETCISEFYANGEKQVTMNILNKLSPLSIAVWYMDDGYTNWSKKGAKPSCNFCTDSFGLDACEMICDWFDFKWSIKAHPRARCLEKGHYRVVVNAVSAYDFIDLIKDHVIHPMLYKVKSNINVIGMDV